MNYIEEHPYLVGSLVLVGIVAFFILRSGSTSSAASSSPTSPAAPNPSVQTAGIAAGVALQQSSNAATVANNQIAAQVAESQIKANADVVQKQLDTNAQIQATLTSGQVALHGEDTSLAIAQVQTGGQVQLAAIDRLKNQDTINGNLDYATIEANKDVTLNRDTITGNLQFAGIQSDLEKYKTDAAVTQTGIIADAQSKQATANDQLQAYLGTLAAGVQLAGIGEKGHESDNVTAVQNNYIDTAGKVAITQSNNQTSVALVDANAKAGILKDIGTATVQNQRSSTGIAQIVAALFGTQQPQQQNSGFSFAVPGLFSVGVQNP